MNSIMMIALLTFFGISALVTLTIIAGLAMSARRAMPTCQANTEDFEFGSGHETLRQPEALLAA